jgi:hypothetical protein
MSDEEVRNAPTSLADLLMKDVRGEFRQVWETGTSQASADLFSRGAVEEQFGYASALGRRTGRFQDPGDASSTFEPKDKSEMPKYGALVSSSQVAGVAPRYGASIIYWKETLRSRVTHTPGDSWGTMGGRLYTSTRHPLPLIADGDIHLVRLMSAEATHFEFDRPMAEKSEAGITKIGTYFETQIHGTLSWSDVSHVVLNWGVFTDKDGKPLPKTSKRDAENLKEKLEAFAATKRYDFLVRLGQEIK